MVARGDDGDPRDSGYVALLVAVALPLFLILAGLALDVGNWYVQAEHVQRAADSAALAGAVYLPTDPSAANAAAANLAGRNGYTTSTAGVTITVGQVTGHPSEMQVTITAPTANVFGALFGYKTAYITRTAIASYAAPVPLGSPCNRMGNEPIGLGDTSHSESSCSTLSSFWLNIAAPLSIKVNGDAIAGGNCSTSGQQVLGGAVDNCTGQSPSPANTDYDANGYVYTVTDPTGGGPLDVQIFDPAFIAVGDTCTATSAGGLTKAVNPWAPDAATRYQSGPTSPFCTGDHNFDSSTSPKYPGANIVTTYTLRGPVTPGTPPLDAPFKCSVQFPGYMNESQSLAPYLTPGTPQYNTFDTGYTIDKKTGVQTNEPGYVASVFRQWVSLCPGAVQSTAPGDQYAVQVRTNVALGGDTKTVYSNKGQFDPMSLTALGEGHNRYAIRAWDPTNSTVQVHGYTSMGLYNQATATASQFYVARISSASAGHILDLSFFDIGDAAQGGTLTVLAPSDATWVPPGGSSPSQWTVAGDDPAIGNRTWCQNAGNVYGGGSGLTLSQDNSTCSMVSNPSPSQFNGKWQTLQIYLPSTYLCHDTDPLGCWFTLKYSYNGGVADTTTWEATVEGDPVRITR